MQVSRPTRISHLSLSDLLNEHTAVHAYPSLAPMPIRESSRSIIENKHQKRFNGPRFRSYISIYMRGTHSVIGKRVAVLTEPAHHNRFTTRHLVHLDLGDAPRLGVGARVAVPVIAQGLTRDVGCVALTQYVCARHACRNGHRACMTCKRIA